MTRANIRSQKLTMLNTSRLFCSIDNNMLVEALAPDNNESPLACSRESAIEQKALRLTGAPYDPP